MEEFTPRLTAIAAVASNGVIGDGAGLLWHYPEDLRRFKALTMGGVLIMGRPTYESLGGALRGRTSIILTRNRSWIPTQTRDCEVLVAASVTELGALLAERTDLQWWSTGGGQVYRTLWDYTTNLDLTQIHTPATGAVTFPEIDPLQWNQTSREPGDQFDFVTYERTDTTAAQALKTLINDAS
ncbi:MAG: dihydrofolate reductase [Propionibacteriaceae bacterium]|nr:dihydrofolate reductase [Propionibacteriaceae bacterium]